ncbi:hypothetical protein Bbelb_264030 [Branchiostoma belcheri]|nr:hypothetical protein Bbelb_264030 [Branchiostoma belcheri]
MPTSSRGGLANVCPLLTAAKSAARKRGGERHYRVHSAHLRRDRLNFRAAGKAIPSPFPLLESSLREGDLVIGSLRTDITRCAGLGRIEIYRTVLAFPNTADMLDKFVTGSKSGQEDKQNTDIRVAETPASMSTPDLGNWAQYNIPSVVRPECHGQWRENRWTPLDVIGTDRENCRARPAPRVIKCAASCRAVGSPEAAGHGQDTRVNGLKPSVHGRENYGNNGYCDTVWRVTSQVGVTVSWWIVLHHGLSYDASLHQELRNE